MTQTEMALQSLLALRAEPNASATQVSLLSTAYPATVLKLAGQQFPGIVVDGNSLFILESAGRALRSCLQAERYPGSPAEVIERYSSTAAGLAEGIAHMLSKLYDHYSQTLALYGIPGPAQATPAPAPVGVVGLVGGVATPLATVSP
jgi:hypothetical protein